MAKVGWDSALQAQCIYSIERADRKEEWKITSVYDLQRIKRHTLPLALSYQGHVNHNVILNGTLWKKRQSSEIKVTMTCIMVHWEWYHTDTNVNRLNTYRQIAMFITYTFVYLPCSVMFLHDCLLLYLIALVMHSKKKAELNLIVWLWLLCVTEKKRKTKIQLIPSIITIASVTSTSPLTQLKSK